MVALQAFQEFEMLSNWCRHQGIIVKSKAKANVCLKRPKISDNGGLFCGKTSPHQFVCSVESASVFAGNPDMAGQMISSTLIIGRVFHSLITEKPTSPTDTALVAEVAASLCFYRQSGSYRVYHADRCSKRLASLHARRNESRMLLSTQGGATTIHII